jgi:lysozyme
MKTNDAGRNIIVEFEKLELEAYPDPGSELAKACRRARLALSMYRAISGWEKMKADPWTIGFGHTGPEVIPGLRWNEETAWRVLEDDICVRESQVAEAVETCLNENQFSALVSWVFNLGIAQLTHGGQGGQPSRLLTKLNAGNLAGAADEFPKWCHSGGEVMPGLVLRREAERKLFLTPVAAAA